MSNYLQILKNLRQSCYKVEIPNSANTEQRKPPFPPESKKQRQRRHKAERRAAQLSAAKRITVIPLQDEPPILDLTDDTASNIPLNSNNQLTLQQGNNDQPGNTGQNQGPEYLNQGNSFKLTTLPKVYVFNSLPETILSDGWTPAQITKWSNFQEMLISSQQDELRKKHLLRAELQIKQSKKPNKNIKPLQPPTFVKIYRRYNIHPTEYFTCNISELLKYRQKLEHMSRDPLSAYKMADSQLHALVKEICEKRMKTEGNGSKEVESGTAYDVRLGSKFRQNVMKPIEVPGQIETANKGAASASSDVNISSNTVTNRLNTPTSGQRDNKKTKSNNVRLTKSQSNRPTPAQALMSERPNQPPETTQQAYAQGWIPPVDEFGRSYPKGIPKSFLLNNPMYAQGHQDAASQILGISGSTFASTFDNLGSPFANDQLFVQTNNPTGESGTYSPTEADGDHPLIDGEPEENDGSESPTTGQKRLSAFRRLGPVTQAKKPKLTINLLFSKEQAVREVLDENSEAAKKPEEHVPVHKRQDILTSIDDTVIKYLPHWPWKNIVGAIRTAMPRSSKSSMMMEQEAMNEGYETNNIFIKIQVKDYPAHYKKEDVLDLLLDQLKGKSFIPCFTEFTPEECRFLVLRSRAALTAFHKMGLYIRKESENINLPMKISVTDLTLSKLDFIPRLVLRQRLRMKYDGEKKLDLTAFCLQSDISHFLYYPLNNPSNQFDIIQLQSAVSWDHLIELNLSKNRLRSVGGFELVKNTPKLKHLDLSHNLLDGMSSTLLPLKGLHLRSLVLEGNPLCMNYVDTQHYIGVAKLIFPSLVEIDGVNVQRKDELPKIRRNYCPEEAMDVIERFLEVFFPLLESPPEDRAAMEDLYHEEATLSLTFCYKLRYNPVYRYFRNLFNRARVIDEDNLDCVEGAANIAKHVSRWPSLQHDPYSFYVDVLHHSDSTTIFRICGILKLTSDSLADDEHLIYFTRSLVLRTSNGAQYRIHNEVLNWDEAIPDCANKAFQVTTVKSKKVSLKLDSAPDEDLKEKFIAIFMKLTEMDRKKSERCLEMRNWDLRNALDYFIKLCKLNSIAALEVADTEV